MNAPRLKEGPGIWHILLVLNVTDNLAVSVILCEKAGLIVWAVLTACLLNTVMLVAKLLEWTKARWPMKASIGTPLTTVSLVIIVEYHYWAGLFCQDVALFIVRCLVPKENLQRPKTGSSTVIIIIIFWTIIRIKFFNISFSKLYHFFEVFQPFRSCWKISIFFVML